jgi:hypothetical protein
MLKDKVDDGLVSRAGAQEDSPWVGTGIVVIDHPKEDNATNNFYDVENALSAVPMVLSCDFVEVAYKKG